MNRSNAEAIGRALLIPQWGYDVADLIEALEGQFPGYGWETMAREHGVSEEEIHFDLGLNLRRYVPLQLQSQPAPMDDAEANWLLHLVLGVDCGAPDLAARIILVLEEALPSFQWQEMLIGAEDGYDVRWALWYMQAGPPPE